MSTSTTFWGAVNAIAFKNTKTQDIWPSLNFGQTIPPHLHSCHKDTSKESVVSFGIIMAVGELLKGAVNVSQAPDQVVIAYQSSGNTAGIRSMRAVMSGTHIQFEGGAGRIGPFLLTIALGVLGYHSDLEEVRERWWNFVGCLSQLRGVRSAQRNTFSDTDLRHASNDHTATERLMALIDAVYYGMKKLHKEGQLDHLDIAVTPPTGSLLPDAFTVLPSPPQQAPAPSSDNSVVDKLSRVARRGGRVLLIGPTGTGKTEAGKAVATTLDRPLFNIKGSPNMEETEFIGGYHMIEGKPELIDGPFVQAFLCAQERPAVLLFDEILRVDGPTMSSTVGILDHVSEKEAALMGIPGLPQGRYYILRHRNQDLIWAPVRNLLIIGTTNYGEGYQQAAGSFDAAFLGRFNLHIEVPYMPTAQALDIYQGVCGDPRLAAAVHAAELETRQNHISRQGLLARELNTRVVVSWLEEIMALIQEGESLGEAFWLAAADCVIPFCVERNELGVLDEAAQKDLERVLDGLAVTL
ncbi:hypothetical protein Dxin01_00800 [Deinococcus xinjiangensis]|uniref:AAA+ ATPase domain-containing protein n=1 Tax=Deinococcus xinjiangensis TaxID=457454 RepID=A0ABP9V728_9DEIO